MYVFLTSESKSVDLMVNVTKTKIMSNVNKTDYISGKDSLEKVKGLMYLGQQYLNSETESNLKSTEKSFWDARPLVNS